MLSFARILARKYGKIVPIRSWTRGKRTIKKNWDLASQVHMQGMVETGCLSFLCFRKQTFMGISFFSSFFLGLAKERVNCSTHSYIFSPSLFLSLLLLSTPLSPCSNNYSLCFSFTPRSGNGPELLIFQCTDFLLLFSYILPTHL